jgi:hypothetical protein
MSFRVHSFFSFLRRMGLFAGVLLFTLSGCTSAYRKSVGADQDKVVSRVYVADFNTAWQSVLEALKSSNLDQSDRDAGVVQTRWMTNTADKNLADSDGGVLHYTQAKLRFRVSLTRGFQRGLPAIKVSVQKEQVVQRDALDELRIQESDGVEERTLVYRIGRILKIKQALASQEEARTQQEIQKSEFNTDGTPPSDQTPSSDQGDLTFDAAPPAAPAEATPPADAGSEP